MAEFVIGLCLILVFGVVQIMNTQKAVSTLAQNHIEKVIKIRRCSDPNQKVQQLYDALKYKYTPFKKKKSVVHKSELEDPQTIEQLDFWTD
jgi:hypothetical protein